METVKAQLERMGMKEREPREERRESLEVRLSGRRPMSAKEVWTWVHYNYGDDLGLTSEDDDYIAPNGLEDLTDKLKDEVPAIKEPGTDSEVTSLTTDPPGVNVVPSNEDTDAVLSDEAFGPRQPQQQQQQQQQNTAKMVTATAAAATEEGGGGGTGNGLVNGDVKVPAEFMDSSDDSDGNLYCFIL
ncbi:gram domain-containing protein 1b [Plakobranchus ocellatus]|uniref:Gram domain-containing protein 1b n=1 Tax=Plakobranchus ocellatus TaxID=259542 RepID=A0AAV4DAS5_9GAST|nr:gram domain-containing protein 1b [Plakobranchus ocellatus]